MATKFLEPGGDATFDFTLWPGSSGGSVIASDIVHGTHPRSIQAVANVVNYVATAAAVVADAGGRYSFFVYVTALPGATTTLASLVDSGGGTVASLRLTSAGVLQAWSNSAQIGTNGATLSTGQWYRISLAWTITSTTVNRFEVWVDGSSSISITNATLGGTGVSRFRAGNISGNATFDARFSDFYIDDSAALTDTGTVWVTAKRPNANGASNQWTTQIGAGGSGYGTGHSPQVNERALSATNGWSIQNAATQTEEYTIEGAATGDIDISGASIVDYMGWVRAKVGVASVGHLIAGGNAATINVTTSYASYTFIRGSTTYPSGTDAIGMDTNAVNQLFSLVECGIVVAYIPPVNASVTGVAATATAAGLAGSVTAINVVSVIGVVATATAAGLDGAVSATVSVTGVATTATAAGLAGQPDASIAGVAATASAAGLAGSVTVTNVASIAGVAAAAAAAGLAGTATVSYFSPVTFSWKGDFDRNGSYEFDITPYITARSTGFDIQRGRGRDGSPMSSTVTLQLDNRDGTWTPEYASSTLYGKLSPGAPIRLQVTHLSTTYTLWTGYLQRVGCQWVAGGRTGTATLTATSLMGVIKDLRPVDVVLATNVLTSAALVNVFNAIGLGAADRNFATGKQTLPYHWARSQTAGDAMMQVVWSEMGGYLWEQKDGALRFEARDTRLGTSVSDTWGDGANVVPDSQAYDIVDQDLVSTVTVTATLMSVGQATEEIFRFSRGKDTKPTADSMALTAGQTYEAEFDYGAPLAALTTPVAVVDYLANTAANGTGTDKTSALTVTVTDKGAGARIKLVNTDAGTIYVTMFRIRGQAASLAGQTPRFVASKSVPTLKADKGVELRVPFADDTQATRDYALTTLRTYRYPYPQVTLSFKWSSDPNIIAAASLELGQRVAYKDTLVDITQSAQVDDTWYVDSIRHQARVGTLPRTTVVLVPSYLYRNLDKCAYDLFTRANTVGALNTSVSGDTWSDAGGFNINSNAARANSDAAQVPSVDLVAADHVVEVSLGNIAADANASVGTCYRKSDTSNYLRAYVDKGSGRVKLDKVVAAVVTNLAQPVWTATDTAEVRVITQGNRHRVWVDRALVIDVTDAFNNTATKVGLFALNASGTVTFDDFYAQGL